MKTETANDRLLERKLALGLKPRLTRAERKEYEHLQAAHEAWLRATGATSRAFSDAFGT